MQAWVVGGTSGIGAATVQLLRKREMSVMVMSNDIRSGQRLRTQGISFESIDLADSGGVIGQRTRDLLSRYGLPTYLFMTVGLTCEQTVIDTSPEDWLRLTRVNLLGIAEFCNTVARAWQDGGPQAWQRHLVIVGSVNAERPLPSQGVYSVMKAGLHAYAKCLSNDLAASQIRVNVVAPGAIWTPMQAPLLADDRDGQKRRRIEQSALVARWGQAEEVAQVAVWIAVESPPFLTAAEVVVDGGYRVKR